jgi:hypothetical protein
MECNGEVESQILNFMYLGGPAQAGGQFICQEIGETQVPFCLKKPFRQNCFFPIEKKLDEKSRVHATQDVRMPLAGMAAIFEQYAKDFNLPEDTNALAHIHYLLCP